MPAIRTAFLLSFKKLFCAVDALPSCPLETGKLEIPD